MCCCAADGVFVTCVPCLRACNATQPDGACLRARAAVMGGQGSTQQLLKQAVQKTDEAAAAAEQARHAHAKMEEQHQIVQQIIAEAKQAMAAGKAVDYARAISLLESALPRIDDMLAIRLSQPSSDAMMAAESAALSITFSLPSRHVMVRVAASEAQRAKQAAQQADELTSAAQAWVNHDTHEVLELVQHAVSGRQAAGELQAQRVGWVKISRMS